MPRYENFANKRQEAAAVLALKEKLEPLGFRVIHNSATEDEAMRLYPDGDVEYGDDPNGVDILVMWGTKTIFAIEIKWRNFEWGRWKDILYTAAVDKKLRNTEACFRFFLNRFTDKSVKALAVDELDVTKLRYKADGGRTRNTRWDAANDIEPSYYAELWRFADTGIELDDPNAHPSGGYYR